MVGVGEKDLVMFGEGGEHCYAYLAERHKKGGAKGFMVSGLDLLTDTPCASASRAAHDPVGARTIRRPAASPDCVETIPG